MGMVEVCIVAARLWKSSQAEDKSASNPYNEAISEADRLIDLGAWLRLAFLHIFAVASTVFRFSLYYPSL